MAAKGSRFFRFVKVIFLFTDQQSKWVMGALLALVGVAETVLLSAGEYLKQLRTSLAVASERTESDDGTGSMVAAITFGDGGPMPFGDVTQAHEAAFVTALVKAGERERSVVCGYASANAGDLRKPDWEGNLRAAAAVHYGSRTRIAPWRRFRCLNDRTNPGAWTTATTRIRYLSSRRFTSET